MAADEDAKHWYDGLSETSRRIAGTTDSPLKVTAGPGTGKTYTLIRRVCRLLEENCDPSRILVCTYTRTAARDLEKELGNLGASSASDVTAGTLHSVCFRILSISDV